MLAIGKFDTIAKRETTSARKATTKKIAEKQVSKNIIKYD